MPIPDPQGRFRRGYNRTNFTFPHGLAGNPLFELQSLAALARRLPGAGEHHWANGCVALDNAWSDGMIGRQSLPGTILHIEHNDSIVIVKGAQRDPRFAPLLQSILAGIIELSGDRLRADAAGGEVSILLNSRGRITPYHIDPEPCFLLQIVGTNRFHIFDHRDRTLVTDRDLENFYATGASSVQCPPDRRDDCARYELPPGRGVHVPTCAPYWMVSDGPVSIALRVRYALRSVEKLAKLHRFNHRLRRLGLEPAPPGASGWRDGLKLAAANGLAAVQLKTDWSASP